LISLLFEDVYLDHMSNFAFNPRQVYYKTVELGTRASKLTNEISYLDDGWMD